MSTPTIIDALHTADIGAMMLALIKDGTECDYAVQTGSSRTYATVTLVGVSHELFPISRGDDYSIGDAGRGTRVLSVYADDLHAALLLTIKVYRQFVPAALGEVSA